MEMVEALLVLILTASGGGEDTKAVTDSLIPFLGNKNNITVVSGDAAKIKIEKEGISAQDLLIDDNIGKFFTKTDTSQKKIIIYIKTEKVATDKIASATIWHNGKKDNFVSISAPDKSPVQGLVNGVWKIIAPEVVYKKKTGGVSISGLVEKKDWQQVLASLAGKKDKTQKEYYYGVLSYIRLGNRDAAVELLNEFKGKHKKHFLISAAEALLPNLPSKEEIDLSMDNGKPVYELTEENIIRTPESTLEEVKPEEEKIEETKLEEVEPQEKK